MGCSAARVAHVPLAARIVCARGPRTPGLGIKRAGGVPLVWGSSPPAEQTFFGTRIVCARGPRTPGLGIKPTGGVPLRMGVPLKNTLEFVSIFVPGDTRINFIMPTPKTGYIQTQ